MNYPVGNLIVFTIHKDGIWLALDKQLLNETKAIQDLLENSPRWRLEIGDYPEYVPVPSKNGYYIPSENDLQIGLLLYATFILNI